MTNPAPNHWRRTERLDVRLSPFERTLLKTISRTFKCSEAEVMRKALISYAQQNGWVCDPPSVASPRKGWKPKNVGGYQP